MSTDAVSIRLQLGIASNPPVTPLDIQTMLQPQAWRGAGLLVDLGIFGPDGSAVDLSDLAFIEVDIFPSDVLNTQPGTNQNYNPWSNQPFPNMPPAPLLFVTIPASGITAALDLNEWQAGNAQQAIAEFTFEQMNSLNLQGQQSQAFWLVVSGQTNAGRRIIYGGTAFTVFESGAQQIYLPNNLAPLVVPLGTILYIPPNQQMIFSHTIDVEGMIVIDGGIMIQV